MDITARLQHPGWMGVVLPLLLAIGATFSPDKVRASLLICAIAAATWTFHRTEYASKKLSRTLLAGAAFLILAAIIFLAGRKFDQSAQLVPTATTVQQPSVAVRVGKNGKWNSLDDTVYGPNGRAIENQGEINSKGLQLNPPNPVNRPPRPETAIIERISELYGESYDVRNSEDLQKWNAKVEKYLRVNCGTEVTTEFLAQHSLFEKRKVLYRYNEHLIQQAASH